MKRYPPHHHIYGQVGIRCPICGHEGVGGAMIKNGRPITRREIRRPRWKLFRRSARGL